MQQLASIKKEIQNSPMMEAMVNQKESIEEIQQEINLAGKRISDLDEKLQIAQELDYNTQALKHMRTRLTRELETLNLSLKAYQSGYVEIPNLGNGQVIEDSKLWGFKLTEKVPLRVFKALKKAKESGYFENIVIQTPQRTGLGNDPIIEGVNGRRHFYISSWR